MPASVRALPTHEAGRDAPGMNVNIIVDRDGEWIRARGKDYYREELFGETREEAVLNYLSAFFVFLSLQIQMGTVELSELSEIRPVIDDRL